MVITEPNYEKKFILKYYTKKNTKYIKVQRMNGLNIYKCDRRWQGREFYNLHNSLYGNESKKSEKMEEKKHYFD